MGYYKAGDQLLSEHQLGMKFAVSRITVRRALQTLESEGLIYRQQGLGAFVSEKRVPQGMVRLTDFIEDMQAAGLEASSKVIFFGQVKASEEVARALGIDEGRLVCRLDRLRLGDNRPVAYDITWLPLFYGQALDGYDLEQGTIYRILENDYDIPVLRGHYRLDAVNAPEDIAGHLGVEPGTALFHIHRTSYTLNEKPIYVQRRYYRSDRVVYELELSRKNSSEKYHRGMPLRDFSPVFKGPK